MRQESPLFISKFLIQIAVLFQSEYLIRKPLTTIEPSCATLLHAQAQSLGVSFFSLTARKHKFFPFLFPQ